MHQKSTEGFRRIGKENVYLLIYYQPHQSSYAYYGEGAEFLEVQRDEGDDADDKAFPVDEVLGCSEAEGSGTNETQHGGTKTTHHATEDGVVFPVGVDLGKQQYDDERGKHHGKGGGERTQDAHEL